MNTLDIMRSGHQTVLDAINDFPDDGWEQPGACGTWTAKDIIAHLASFEAVLVDILRGMNDEETATPALDSFITDYERFNEREVQARHHQSPQAILDEYSVYHADVLRLIQRLPESVLRQNGALDWYGAAYDLEDFLVYTFYGHKREHCAQILAQRDRLLKNHES